METTIENGVEVTSNIEVSTSVNKWTDTLHSIRDFVFPFAPWFIIVGVMNAFLVQWISPTKLETKKMIYAGLLPLFTVLVSLTVSFIFGFLYTKFFQTPGVGDGLSGFWPAVILIFVTAFAFNLTFMHYVVGLSYPKALLVAFVDVITAIAFVAFDVPSMIRSRL